MLSIDHFLADMATTISNKALSTDPDMQETLARLNGRIIEVECTAPALTGHVVIDGEQMVFEIGEAQCPHVRIKGNAQNLLKWLTQRDPEDLIIDGDHNVLLEFLDLAQRFDPDVEHTLSAIVGRDIAAKAADAAELSLKSLQSVAQSIAQGLEDTVQKRAYARFVSKDEFDTLLDGIDELRLRVDRLSANLKQRDSKSQ